MKKDLIGGYFFKLNGNWYTFGVLMEDRQGRVKLPGGFPQGNLNSEESNAKAFERVWQWKTGTTATDYKEVFFSRTGEYENHFRLVISISEPILKTDRIHSFEKEKDNGTKIKGQCEIFEITNFSQRILTFQRFGFMTLFSASCKNQVFLNDNWQLFQRLKHAWGMKG